MQSNLESRRKQFERRQHDDTFSDTSDFDARKKNRQQLLDEEIAEYDAMDKKYDTARMRNSKEEMAELELRMQASLERQYDLKRQIAAVDKEKTDFLKQQSWLAGGGGGGSGCECVPAGGWGGGGYFPTVVLACPQVLIPLTQPPYPLSFPPKSLYLIESA